MPDKQLLEIDEPVMGRSGVAEFRLEFTADAVIAAAELNPVNRTIPADFVKDLMQSRMVTFPVAVQGVIQVEYRRVEKHLRAPSA